MTMSQKEKICKTCGKSFTGHHKALYCSPECVPKRSHKKKPAKAAPPPATPPEVPAPPETPPETPAPPEVPAPDTVPPTETTTPLNSGDGTEDKGESGSKPFRKFFYD